MSSVTNRITIARPIEDVFAVLTDVEKARDLVPGRRRGALDLAAATRGRFDAARRSCAIRGRTVENDAVVTEYDPPYRTVIAGTSPNAPFVGTLVFAREGETTRVEVTTELAFRGASRIVGPVFAAWYGRSWARGLETLKRLMEAGEL